MLSKLNIFFIFLYKKHVSFCCSKYIITVFLKTNFPFYAGCQKLKYLCPNHKKSFANRKKYFEDRKQKKTDH